MAIYPCQMPLLFGIMVINNNFSTNYIQVAEFHVDTIVFLNNS